MVWLGSPGGPRCLKEIAGSLPQPFPFLHSASFRALGACPMVCVCGLGSPDPWPRQVQVHCVPVVWDPGG